MWRKSQILCKTINVPHLLQNRLFSVTPVQNLNQKWRKERNLPLNPNACGVLTDGPDFTYLDGRPTPYGVGQRNRIQKQKELVEKIIALTAEVDFAVDRYNQQQMAERDARAQIIDGKLQAKGVELLKKQKKTKSEE